MHKHEFKMTVTEEKSFFHTKGSSHVCKNALHGVTKATRHLYRSVDSGVATMGTKEGKGGIIS